MGDNENSVKKNKKYDFIHEPNKLIIRQNLWGGESAYFCTISLNEHNDLFEVRSFEKHDVTNTATDFYDFAHPKIFDLVSHKSMFEYVCNLFVDYFSDNSKNDLYLYTWKKEKIKIRLCREFYSFIRRTLPNVNMKSYVVQKKYFSLTGKPFNVIYTNLIKNFPDQIVNELLKYPLPTIFLENYISDSIYFVKGIKEEYIAEKLTNLANWRKNNIFKLSPKQLENENWVKTIENIPLGLPLKVYERMQYCPKIKLERPLTNRLEFGFVCCMIEHIGEGERIYRKFSNSPQRKQEKNIHYIINRCTAKEIKDAFYLLKKNNIFLYQTKEHIINKFNNKQKHRMNPSLRRYSNLYEMFTEIYKYLAEAMKQTKNGRNGSILVTAAQLLVDKRRKLIQDKNDNDYPF